MPRNPLRQPSFTALLALAWLLVAIVLLLRHWPQTAETLLDTDDAMRLVQLRAWLAGQNWFDLHQARLQPPEGYDSHWSRLVDAGLAGLLLSLQAFVDAASAERLMRAIWPLAWLLPTMAGMVAIAWRLAGREAAMVGLLLALVGVPAYQQFTPGRIDHHNVQIALTLLVVAATVWSDRLRWPAIGAGALGGLALAIGFECLPFMALGGAALALRAMFDRDAGTALRDYGVTLAASTVLALVATVAPARWGESHCDALAINGAAAVATAGLALAVTGQFAFERMAVRALAVACAGCAAFAVLLSFEPRCLRGPFALVDPAIWPIWHDHVRELQPLLSVFRINPLTGAAIAAFPAAALCAGLVLARERGLRRDFGFVVACVAFVVAAGTTVAAIRGYSYAMWLGMPLVAVAALRLCAALKLESPALRLGAALLLTPMALSTGAIVIAHAAGLDDGDSFARPASRACYRSASVAALARLPAGLVVGDISYGPYLLALTPHAVMAAPYHRLSRGIAVAQGALSAPPEAARRILAGAGATYVVLCGPRAPDGLAGPARDRSLWAALRAGTVPEWLEVVPGMQPFAVYRIRS